MKKIFLILFVLASINLYARVGDDNFSGGLEGTTFEFTEVEISSEYIGCQFVGRKAFMDTLKCMNGLDGFGYVPHGSLSVETVDGTFYITQIMKKK